MLFTTTLLPTFSILKQPVGYDSLVCDPNNNVSMLVLGILCRRKLLHNVFLYGKREFHSLISQVLLNEFHFFFCFKRQIESLLLNL